MHPTNVSIFHQFSNYPVIGNTLKHEFLCRLMNFGHFGENLSYLMITDFLRVFYFSFLSFHHSLLENFPWTCAKVELAHGLVIFTLTAHWNYLLQFRKYCCWVSSPKDSDLICLGHGSQGVVLCVLTNLLVDSDAC